MSLEFALQPDLPPVSADPAQLRQIVLNLLSNASEAIGDRPGRIQLRTGSRDLDAEALRELGPPGEGGPGAYVLLEVSDDGCGMDEATLQRIFDPFFTTKFTGRGLGLAAVLGIVRRHNGRLAVSSRPGEGSRFTLFLPALSGAPAAESPPPAALHDAPAENGEGRILLIDDEERVRKVGAAILQASGYEVVEAVAGEEGLARFRAEPGSYRLVISDLTMPRMDGREALEAIRSLNGRIPVILISGYNHHGGAEAFPGPGPSEFLHKPFDPDQLRRLVHELLVS